MDDADQVGRIGSVGKNLVAQDVGGGCQLGGVGQGRSCQHPVVAAEMQL